MADLKPTHQGEAKSAQLEVIRGTNTTRLAIIHGLTIILSILCVGIVVAILKDQKQERDYVGVLMPVLMAAISGFGGFLAGQKSRKD